jgi:hypothetical protein
VEKSGMLEEKMTLWKILLFGLIGEIVPTEN